MSVTPLKYIEAFYSLFNEYNGIGFLGTKEILRYRLQLKLNRYIPKSYVNATLSHFRKLGLVESFSTNSHPLRINIMDMSFKGAKYLYPKIDVDENTVKEKYKILEEMLHDVEEVTCELISKEQLESIKKVQSEKKKICDKYFKGDYRNYFAESYDNGYGFWTQEVTKERAAEYFNRISSYDDNFFLSEYEKINKAKEKQVEYLENRNESFKKIVNEFMKIINKEISEQHFVIANIGSKYNTLKIVAKITSIVMCDDCESFEIADKDKNFIGIVRITGIVIDDTIKIMSIEDSFTTIGFKLNSHIEDELHLLSYHMEIYNSKYKLH